MAQKTQPARKSSATAAKSKVASKKTGVAPKKAKAPAKSSAKALARPVKTTQKLAAPAKAKSKAAVEKAGEPQIVKAKAALKKESAVAAKPEGKTRGRKINVEVNPGEAASALSSKWNTLYKKAEQIEAKPYNMRAIFEEKTAITHKVLGWGYILANRNDRLEVLFKDGIKYLISNYKP